MFDVNGILCIHTFGKPKWFETAMNKCPATGAFCNPLSKFMCSDVWKFIILFAQTSKKIGFHASNSEYFEDCLTVQKMKCM